MRREISIFWFRRDLRIDDNTGLNFALNSDHPVLPIFIFDPSILDQLEDKSDRRVDYIHQSLRHINNLLQKFNASVNVFVGEPLAIFKELNTQYTIKAVFCNRDYEPQAIKRDKFIYDFFKNMKIPFKAYKDQVIFDKSDIIKKDGNPYTVYTPYAKKWKEKLQTIQLSYTTSLNDNFYQQDAKTIPSLSSIGFKKTTIQFSIPVLDEAIIDDYDKTRDFPALEKTTQLGIALRFGTISIRQCVLFAQKHNQTWLSELIWREFFMQILYHFPNVVYQSFKKKYEAIQWRNNEDEFKKWCEGKTGYPIVDAGMRQLNATGFMHNRVRMIVASFLCKHLLIDWRWGESYFASKLDDYDLSANNGNWQWAAGCGCDAAPYFRIFNPELQTNRFDNDFIYIKKWVKEFNSTKYFAPIVDHSFARVRALATYSSALKE